MQCFQAFLALGICVGLGGSLLSVRSVPCSVPCLARTTASLGPPSCAKVMGLVASGTEIGNVQAFQIGGTIRASIMLVPKTFMSRPKGLSRPLLIGSF